MSGTRTKIRCTACKQKIRGYEPDILLEDMSEGGKPRYFHERCAGAAYAAAAERPRLYRLVVRHVDEGVN